ncbi:BamA/TamA family outer membrane protein [Chitinophagaceae bacterium LB-8]|uniref:BamA/TamA family outer membrane protein n=1 Tax=Paraflavisolibacter caeni TaxID=2982496 RepID=A0A9X3BGP3_9BACT|nr:BamA/TamA family outer membrane protein [Paraflavisolibacter caeni]MCU7548122.1 BamA/TamA family outer membrane protein [Paraflavisolibacter caeni]
MFYSWVKSYRQSLLIYVPLMMLIIVSSCTIIKGYPKNKPFIYQTNIHLNGKFTKDQKKELESELYQQLHDSIMVRSVRKFNPLGIFTFFLKKGPRLIYTEIVKPAVFDSLNAEKSKTFMAAKLHSLGYYRDSISYDTSLQVRGVQSRTTVNFHVTPGHLFLIDSVLLNLATDTASKNDDTLQKITLDAQKESLLKKGEAFAMPLISTEFDRLTDVYRNNGYLRFSREELLAVWDTVGLALLRPTLDPIEQATQLQELRRRRENPSASVEVRLRETEDTTRLTRYYVGNVVAYPDLSIDTATLVPFETYLQDYKIISYRNLFKPKLIARNIYLKRGDLYSQRNYLHTINRFNSLGAWRLVSIDQIPRDFSDTVDFRINLTPAKKYLFNFDIEGSSNQQNKNPFIPTDLLGVGANVGLQNRNFGKASNQANTGVRYGIELESKDKFIQTNQIALINTVAFPRTIPNLNFIPSQWKENSKTIFALNASNVDRKDFFNLTAFNTSWGLLFNWKNKLLGIKLPNIELTFLDRDSLLEELIKDNKSYSYIFNDGLVTSSIYTFSQTTAKKTVTSVKQFNLEPSGLILGMFKNKTLDSSLYRFIKLDAEFRQTRKLGRDEFAWRAFAGVGYELPSTHNRNNTSLPFFKQYYGGGSNSMRAWALRKLGPGSTVQSFDQDVAPERFGDIQLETNAEYRFFITDIGGVLINSALYTDIGNVWFLREAPGFPGGEFKFNKLWKDLAIGTGTGLRIDFGFFLVRLDYAYKVKNPSPDTIEAQNKWFYNWKPLNGQLQLGINYPF